MVRGYIIESVSQNFLIGAIIAKMDDPLAKCLLGRIQHLTGIRLAFAIHASLNSRVWLRLLWAYRLEEHV